MKESDLPGTCQAAETASASAQSRHFRLLRAHIGLLVAIAVIAAWSPQDPELHSMARFTTSALMLVALVAALVQRSRRYDSQWFASRAVAENVKSLMWQYAMGAFQAERDVDLEFVQAVRDIRERFPDSQHSLAEAIEPEAPEITNRMQGLRVASAGERLMVYRDERIRDQVQWYGQRAKSNRRQELKWSGLVIAFETLAVVLSFLAAFHPHWIDLTGAIAAAASALIAWSQARRFADLSTAYSVAHQDLKYLEVRSGKATKEADLTELVRAVEGAISREHGMWLARVGAGGVQL